MSEDDERQSRWAAHCYRMAEATQEIADWCDDLAMMKTYVELAAKWINMAKSGPPPSARATH